VIRILRVTLALAVVAMAFGANTALACPSCASPLEENRQAFVDTTIFLTVVPLAMIGGLIWFIRRRAREMERTSEIPLPETLLRDATRFSKGR